MSRFNLTSFSGSTTETTTPAFIDSPGYSTDENEEDYLPYPIELPRSDFLKADFDPQEYLSSLRNRHQALEDLRSDLRSRSQLLNQELLDLVNSNYEEFLSLGSDLDGGEDKVEGVRVGLLGFTRDIEALRLVITSKEAEFSGLLEEGRSIRKEVVLARKLLKIETNLASLEITLGTSGTDTVDEENELDEELEDDEDASMDDTTLMLRRLSRTSESYILLQNQFDAIGSQHPFLVNLKPRLDEIRKVLLLDMSTALRQARSASNPKHLLALSELFSMIEAEKDAIQLLKAK